MDINAANLIVEQIGFGELREGYLGRGRRNETCGVVVEHVGDVAIFFGEFCEEGDDNLQKLLDAKLAFPAIDEKPRWSFEFDGEEYQTAFAVDNMGKNYIIY